MEINLFKKNKRKDNASKMPARYFGLHFAEGIARYENEDVTSYISGRTAKAMDKTFDGKPLVVQHVDDYTVEEVESMMDGVVVRSFYNPWDGKHWAEFMVHTDAGHTAIAKGWKLSNSYNPLQKAAGGTWHGAPYDEEITDAEYHHLAIVPNPRYSESVIMTPDQFKEYNNRLEAEHNRRKNSLDGENMFELFKKQKVDNSKELLDVSVKLPKSGKTMTLDKVLNSLDDSLVAASKPAEAKETDTVKIGDEVISIAEFKTRYDNACKKNKKNEEKEDKMDNEEDEDEKKDNEEDDDLVDNEDDEDEKKDNEEVVHPKDDGKKLNAKKKNALEEAKKKDNFDKINNAHVNPKTIVQNTLSVGSDFMTRGQALYGSDKVTK